MRYWSQGCVHRCPLHFLWHTGAITISRLRQALAWRGRPVTEACPGWSGHWHPGRTSERRQCLCPEVCNRRGRWGRTVVDKLCVPAGFLKLLCHHRFPVDLSATTWWVHEMQWGALMDTSFNSVWLFWNGHVFSLNTQVLLGFEWQYLAIRLGLDHPWCIPTPWCGYSSISWPFHIWLYISLLRGCLEGFGCVLCIWETIKCSCPFSYNLCAFSDS